MKYVFRIFLFFLATLSMITSIAKEKSYFKYDSLLNEYKCKGDSCKNIKYLMSQIEAGSQDSIQLASYYHYAGVYYHINKKDKDYLLSIKHNKKAAEFRAKFEGGWHWKSLRNIGISYYRLRDFANAYKFLNQAYQVYDKKNNDNEIVLLRNITKNLVELGEYEYAEDLMMEALKLDVSDQQLIMALNTIAKISYQTKKFDKAIPFLKKSLIINDQIKKSLSSTVYYKNRREAINNLGRCFDEIGESDKAIELYKKEILEIDKKNDFEHLVIFYNNIATSLNSKKKYKEAISKLILSLEISKEGYNEKYQYKYSPQYENLADNYAALQQFNTALIHYQKALINLTNNFRSEDILQNPNPKDTSLFIYSNLDMIQVLHLKAISALKYHQQNKEEKYLNLAYKCYQTAFDFHDKLQKNISTENSRLFQAKNIVTYIENALKVAHRQQQNGQDVSKAAFRFMEKNKATVLLQSMNEADALQFANLPDNLLEQEKDLKIALTYYNKQLNEAIEYENTAEIDQLRSLLFDEKEKYRQLINNLENNYPNYYQLKYQQNETKLVDVQAHLDNKTALLEYFVGDSVIYTLLIQKDTVQLIQLPKPGNWKAIIEDFRQSLTLTDTIQTSELDQQFVESATQLYEWLIKDVTNNLDKEITSLQIIPDGLLNYIPFEVLLTKQDTTSTTINYKTLPYLIREKAIGYSYSTALWLEQEQQKQSTKNNLSYAGFAPKYGKASGQFNLPFAKQSVRENAGLWEGKAFIEEEATAQQFETSVEQFSVLQLAMHVNMIDDKPMETYMQFSQTNDGVSHKLRAADLYNIKLDADLAVLGACNTGVGQLQNGEGVMSLSRAFTYAGCSSLMMSLWSIVDESTATIVNRFFKNLKRGKSKHIALQQAKLDFLENAPLAQVHPRYWAGLVVSGNQQAIVKKADYKLWAMPFIVLILAGVFFFISKKI